MPDRFQDEPSSSGTVASQPNDGRRQHRYTTKDLKPERPWKKWCFTAICCLICIALMILLTLWLQSLFDPDEDEDWDDDVVNATEDDGLLGVAGALSGAASLLPQNMEYIEDVCSETHLGQDDKTMCEQACGPAKDCCDPFRNGGNSTCFETEGSGCFAYAKCHSLDGFLDPAHNDLDRICNKASIEINREECALACDSVSCCFSEEESCVASNFQACMDYASCQNLKGDSIDVAPMDLGDRCRKQSNTCKRDCRDALACSDPNSATYRDNFISCLSYSSCTGNSETQITVAPIYSRVDPSINVEEVCSLLGLAGGAEECFEACAGAQCCWDTGADGCFGDDPLGCLEYQRCAVLNRPEYSGLTFPPVIARPVATEAAVETDAPVTTLVPTTTEAVEDTLAPSETPNTAAPGNETETATDAAVRKLKVTE